MHKLKNSPFWEYLEASGVLEKGSDEEIKAVKKAYRKKYFTEYKRSQRKRNAEFTVVLSKFDGVFERINNAATKHHLSIPAFLKKAALAYLEKIYIVPNRLMVANLEQLLSNCLNEIKGITYSKERWWEREHKLDRIEKRIAKLETEMNALFQNPALYSHDHQN